MLLHNTEIAIPGGSVDLRSIVSGFSLDTTTIITGFNLKTKKLVEKELASTRKSSSKELVYIEVSTDEHLIITPDHRVFDLDHDKFIRACDLNKGSKLQHVMSEPCEVTDIHMIRNDSLQDTYTLTVAECENFFASSVLVHNHKEVHRG